MALTAATRDKLRTISTATVATALFKRGFRTQFIQNVHPLSLDQPVLVGEAFTLPPIKMAIRSKDAMSGPDGLVKDFDIAGPEKPGVIGFADDASVFSVNLEAFVPVHAYRHGQFQVAERPIQIGRAHV